MPGKRSPARLIVALSVAAVLAVFLLYTSIAGGGTPSLQPSQLKGHAGRVSLVGIVAGQPTGDAFDDKPCDVARCPGTTAARAAFRRAPSRGGQRGPHVGAARELSAVEFLSAVDDFPALGSQFLD